MSHFSVLVIGENVDEQLAKYDENIETEPRVNSTVSDEEKKTFMNYYIEKDETLKNKSFDEIYKIKGKDWNSNTWKKNKEGIWQEWTTYNPDSKWDWYVVGGRWAGMLKAKKGDVGDMSTFDKIDPRSRDEYFKKMVGKFDSAKIEDIDFTPDEEEIKKAKRFWELYVEGDKPKNKEEIEMIDFVFYKKEYYLKEYKDKEDYAKRQTEFSTFAVVRDGIWYEKGTMGWFGCHSASHKQSKKWDKSYYDTFLKDLPKGTILTIVDCHI